ncbi:MAG: holo-ACP synthase [Acidimicrobiaceae bacterium]|nr:holo-ACP synthase [Acidimicrobiaceae bacterium]
MSVRVGTDILEIARFRTVLERRPGLRKKLFTPEEILYCDAKKDNIPHLAARFCAKEAFSKAIGTGVRNFSMSEVEVVRNGLGKPNIVLYGRARNVAANIAIKEIDLSISHSGLFVAAVVLIEI